MDSITSTQTYQKGRLHMLRGILGDELFWEGIPAYFALRMNSSATTADFIGAMEESSVQDLSAFFG
jgi:aminopeptidase N